MPTNEPIDIFNQTMGYPPDHDDICVICQETLNNSSNNQVCTLECKHRYHTSCIIAWFRTGSNKCPYCGHKGVNGENKQTNLGMRRRRRYSRWGFSNDTNMNNFQRLITYSRRKDAPECLVKIVEKLRLYEKNLEDAKQELDEFTHSKNPELTFKEAGELHKKLQSKLWNARSQVIKQKNVISSYHIIPLIIPRIKNIPNNNNVVSVNSVINQINNISVE